MRRRLGVATLLAGFFLTAMAPLGLAQPGGGPADSGGSDTGDILGTPATAADKVSCWVHRTPDLAIATSVYRDATNNLIFANIRQYAVGSDSYTAAQTRIVDGATPAYELDTVLVWLKPKMDDLGRVQYYELLYHPNGYNPNGTGKAPAIPIGWARYYRGKGGRETSDTLFRFNSKFLRVGMATPTAVPPGAAAASVTAPCDTPPIDDIGEEELVTSTVAGTPGASLPLVPVDVVE